MNKNFLKIKQASYPGLVAFFFLVAFAFYVAISSVSFEIVGASSHTEDVTVTASIEEFFTLEVSTTTLDLGILVTAAGVGAIGDDSLTITTGSNRTAGYTIAIQSANAGLEQDSQLHTIDSADATLSAGTDGYGAQCSNDTGVTCSAAFDVSGNVVGGLTPATTNLEFASTGTPGTGHTSTLTVKAASELDNPTGDYTDTITLTALASL